MKLIAVVVKKMKQPIETEHELAVDPLGLQKKTQLLHNSANEFRLALVSSTVSSAV